MTELKKITLKGRSAARLAAVQALYQVDIEPTDPRVVIGQFISLRFKKPETYHMKNPDITLFETIVMEALANKLQYDTLISNVLSKDWSLDRLESVLRAILRCGICELDRQRETPKAVIINEYVNLTKTFYDGQEPGFINASLDKLAQILER